MSNPVVRMTFDTSQARAQLAQLGAKVSRVVPRALNRAGTSARAAMVPLVAKDMGMKSGTVRERIVPVKADAGRLVFTLRASAKRIPLIEFDAKGPRPSYGRGRGVSARGASGRKTYPRAFLATVGSGHEGVFERKTSARLPIRELFGPSIAHVFLKHVEVGKARGQEALIKNLQSEINYALLHEQ